MKAGGQILFLHAKVCGGRMEGDAAGILRGRREGEY